jgi:hypothetical protein
MYDSATDVRTAMQLAEENFWATDIAHLAQITLVRAAPNSLKRRTLEASDKLLGRIAALGARLTVWQPPRVKTRDYRFYKRLSVPLVDQFLADEPGKSSSGRYTYVHTILSHGPYVWNSKCGPSPRKSSYRKQAKCATLLMKKIVQQLKQLGRTEYSVIIFQSDHGTHVLDKSAARSEIQPFTAEMMRKLGVDEKSLGSDNWYFLRLHALLAIKPPRAQIQPMQISQRAVQLADLPATIYDLVGIRAATPDNGTAIFALPETAEREINVFFRRPDLFQHFSYTSAGRWQVHSDIVQTEK